MDFKTGHFYHIYNRGNNSQKVFFNRENYLFFLRKMKKHFSPFGSVISWCLMPNLFHIVVFVHKDKVENSHSMTASHTMTDSELNTVIIGIGSNIDAEKNIQEMLQILAEKVDILKVSSFIKTKPIGIENQSEFTNGAVKIKTSLNKEDLTVLLKAIEDRMGRDRTAPKFGPRNIDLDIVVWNGEIVDDDYYTRDFLQKNVNELL